MAPTCFIMRSARLAAAILMPAILQGTEIEDLGIAARSAEIRSVTAFRSAAGRRLAILRMQDRGPTGYLLLVDVDNRTSRQYDNPRKVRQGDSFGSILTHDEKYLYDQTGGRVLEFDWKTGKTRLLGRPDPDQTVHFMCYYQDEAGTVWMGGYPRATLSSYSPETGRFRNYGRMDKQEKYLFFLASDAEGWIYCGIGTARANLVAFHPATGERRELLPESERKTGSVSVIAGRDGFVYASIGTFKGKYRNGTFIGPVTSIPPARHDRAARSFSPNSRRYDFGDGSTIVHADADSRSMIIREKDGTLTIIPFDFTSGGLNLTSLGAGPDGKVYGSTSHPLRFVEVDVPGGGRLIDHGGLPMGGNLCAIASDRRQLYACEYAGGRMWEMDPSRPLQLTWKSLHFNGGPDRLLAASTVRNGRLNRMNNPPLLYGSGEDENAEFRFILNHPETGKCYLNVQLFRNANYGKAVLDFHGTRREIDLEAAVDSPAPMVNLGPFELPAGQHELKVTLKPGSRGKRMFGIMAAALEPEKRTTPPAELNPHVVGAWPDLITRPRAILLHPDGRSVIMSGFANYGLTGGGFGIHDRVTGRNRTVAEWLPGHSCIALSATAGGELVGGTSVEAPGGGREKVSHAALFRLSWPECRVLEQVEITGSRNIVAVEIHQGTLFAVTAEGELLIAPPERLAEFRRQSWPAEWGAAPRKALLSTGDRLFLLLRGGIAEISPDTGHLQLLVRSQDAITAGGAIQNGALYFAMGRKVGRFFF